MEKDRSQKCGELTQYSDILASFELATIGADKAIFDCLATAAGIEAELVLDLTTMDLFVLVRYARGLLMVEPCVGPSWTSD